MQTRKAVFSPPEMLIGRLPVKAGCLDVIAIVIASRLKPNKIGDRELVRLVVLRIDRAGLVDERSPKGSVVAGPGLRRAGNSEFHRFSAVGRDALSVRDLSSPGRFTCQAEPGRRPDQVADRYVQRRNGLDLAGRPQFRRRLSPGSTDMRPWVQFVQDAWSEHSRPALHSEY